MSDKKYNIILDDDRTLIAAMDFVDIVIKLIPYLYIEMTPDEHKHLIDELIYKYIDRYKDYRQ